MKTLRTKADVREFVANIRDYSLPGFPPYVAEFGFETVQPGTKTCVVVRVRKDGTWERRARQPRTGTYDESFTPIADPVEYVWEYRREISRYLQTDEDLKTYHRRRRYICGIE